MPSWNQTELKVPKFKSFALGDTIQKQIKAEGVCNSALLSMQMLLSTSLKYHFTKFHVLRIEWVETCVN